MNDEQHIDFANRLLIETVLFSLVAFELSRCQLIPA